MKLSNIDLQKIAQVKVILEKEYKSATTQAELARRVNTNESKLRKGFKLVNNVTINEYLIGVRIEKAKEMLETTDEPVKVVATVSGDCIAKTAVVIESGNTKPCMLPPTAFKTVRITGFNMYLPFPVFTIDLPASKSRVIL